MQRHRSQRVERSFAHVCETGGARRTWLRGLEKINKRYSMVVAAHNLGLLMRNLFGSGKPRQAAFAALVNLPLAVLSRFLRSVKTPMPATPSGSQIRSRRIRRLVTMQTCQSLRISTAC